MGRPVRVPQPVRRIISLAPSLTETVFALGAGDRLAGDTDYCDYPAAAAHQAKLGGVINPSHEKIPALRPDLVLVTYTIIQRATALSLRQIGIDPYLTRPPSVR